MSTTIAFVANAGSGSISVLALDEPSGSLAPVQELVLGGRIMPLALAPSGRFLWAVRRSDPLAVLSLAIDAHSGRLELIGETALPSSMAHIATDASGRWLLCASYHDGLVTVCAIDTQGRVQPAHQVLASGPKTHALRTSPDNTQALAAVLGEDIMLRYAFDPARGRLGEPEKIALPRGSGPRHLALHPSGQAEWVLGELDGQVHSLCGRHRASALPKGFADTPWAADLRLAPNGRHLYASERTSSTLTLFEVDGESGALQRQGQWPTQAQPRGFAISPGGGWLLCAGERSHRVGLHRIDATSGTLEVAGDIAVGQEPNWIETIALPQTL